jgi:hypothetical protein
MRRHLTPLLTALALPFWVVEPGSATVGAAEIRAAEGYIRNLTTQDCLTTNQNSRSVRTQKCETAPQAQWRLEPQDGGSYRIQNVATGQCLAAVERTHAVRMWTCNKDKYVRWHPAAESQTVQNAGSGECLSVLNRRVQVVLTKSCAGDALNRWQLPAQG